MKKIKYFYNTHTLRYEKLEVPLRVQLLRVFGFLSTAMVTAAIIVWLGFRYIGSPNERILHAQLDDYRLAYNVMEERIHELEKQMKELEKRDNEVYRQIFEANPIPDSARARELVRLEEMKQVQRMSDNQLITGLVSQLTNLSNRVAFQQKSYGDIEEMIRDKEKLLAAIPAIQPISNKELGRIASGFGNRIDPVYKVTKFHAGLDFTAPQGTPIYATADGRVTETPHDAGGYGNHVVINHGYGYETLYGHMVKIKARTGQNVKRGEVIGYVGSTGKSTGPHCHYEVHKNGERVNPVYFFYNDLTPEQFDRILKLATATNQSFD